VKQRLVDKIAKDYCLRPEILALEYASELQQQVIFYTSVNLSKLMFAYSNKKY
jgi:hypothetical protein